MFVRASSYVQDAFDRTPLCTSLEWLLSQQESNGEFVERGRVFRSEMQVSTVFKKCMVTSELLVQCKCESTQRTAYSTYCRLKVNTLAASLDLPVRHEKCLSSSANLVFARNVRRKAIKFCSAQLVFRPDVFSFVYVVITGDALPHTHYVIKEKPMYHR